MMIQFTVFAPASIAIYAATGAWVFSCDPISKTVDEHSAALKDRRSVIRAFSSMNSRSVISSDLELEECARRP